MTTKDAPPIAVPKSPGAQPAEQSSRFQVRIRRPQLATPTLSLTLFATTTSLLVGFLLLDQVRPGLNASRADVHWILVVTLLVGTTSTWLTSAFTAFYEPRRLLAVVTGCLAVGSAICAAAPNITVFSVGEVIGSVGFASLGLSLVMLRERLE